MILTWFHDSRTCHPLKDLEAPLAKAASINKLRVKDLLKELTDESKLRVEKIGNVNWYWCWAGEDVRERKAVVAQLERVLLQCLGNGWGGTGSVVPADH